MTAPVMAGSTRASLTARLPEAAAWLALYETARAAFADRAWRTAVPDPGDAPPLVDGVTFTVDGRAVGRLVRALLRRDDISQDDARTLLAAAIAEDEAAIGTVATRLALPAATAALAGALGAMPLLQACRHAWAPKIPEPWDDAACPVCGAWAALVEARGLERRLAHRCARCGAAWAARPVHCAFCGNDDHARITALVSARAEERARVEACLACSGYLKTITLLSPTPPEDVALLDLDTVHLDIAAIEHDFRRPPPRTRRVALIAPARAWR